MQVQTFYLALTPATKTLVNAAAGGALMNKTEDAAYSLLEEMAMNNDHGGSGRNILRKQMPISEVESVKALTEQIAALVSGARDLILVKLVRQGTR